MHVTEGVANFWCADGYEHEDSCATKQKRSWGKMRILTCKLAFAMRESLRSPQACEEQLVLIACLNEGNEMNAEGTPKGFEKAKHLVAAIAWVLMFLYANYLVAGEYFSSKPITPFHVLVPIVLLLVSIRAIKRYVQRYVRDDRTQRP